MAFEPFQKFIKRAAVKHGIAKEAAAAKVCHDFRTLIPELFESLFYPEKYIKPAHYKNGSLTINVENPAWGQEVIMRKEKIIREMNRKAGEEIIKNLKTQLKNEEAA